ncbi:Flp pilus assembly protein CpaB [Novosphingobium mangrovi (ex Huang et al. 2023)]|uniref:Flp pilus assembly protein CpaB n=1 Tax=Novosphingobium mangrovi (ex Huang et al. 2023) TaxID=2976432 RepID=A0ABT2I4X4_9SPHN|nr:Flp pilus assembly protein CpaB [Novosphingobium mangrovi (ex Huang et al. 2023)]MCT2399658.1 Flp pilus assembly protein CpaB [Novosphingobium mangrovi (ex Huang et al. 2023)]
MDKKKLVLLVVALLVAVGTALAARSLFTGASAPQAEAVPVQPKGPKVLVAQRALPVGTIITADAVSFQDWPEELVKDAYFIDGEADMGKLLGTVVRYPVTAGQPLTQGALVAPGDRGFLAAALGPGMRAVTIPVSAQTGVGGFVFPGDRVDLMLTQQVKGEGEPLRTAETILRNLRVLATDQATDNDVVDGKTVVKAFRTVTLEVTPRIAEKVAVAQEIGAISLSLRSIADNQGEFERALANGDVKVPEGATKEQEEQLMRQAMAKPIEGKTTYVTGGDVSRFQRSSRPAMPGEGGARPPMMAYGSAGASIPAGPVVRVTRGKETTLESVGAK